MLGTSLRGTPKLRHEPFVTAMLVYIYAADTHEAVEQAGEAWSSVVIHGKS